VYHNAYGINAAVLDEHIDT